MNDARVTLHNATDILEIVPVLLGFVPTESLVAIYLQATEGRRRVAMTARLDLPPSPNERDASVRMLDTHAARHDAVILVAYSVDTAAADDALLHFLANCEPTKIQAAISATPEGWAEVERQGPILRHAYPTGSSQIAAELVAAGLVRPGRCRDDLRDSIAAPDETEATEFAGLVAGAEPMTSVELARWLQHWITSEPAEATLQVCRDDVAVLVASVQDIRRRDAAWAAITCADADRHIDLWRQVARLVDDRLALPVLGLLGMAAWIAGQGALANLVLERSQQTEGYAAYSLFELLREVLRLGIDPRTWD